jgi:hypothetical protein
MGHTQKIFYRSTRYSVVDRIRRLFSGLFTSAANQLLHLFIPAGNRIPDFHAQDVADGEDGNAVGQDEGKIIQQESIQKPKTSGYPNHDVHPERQAVRILAPDGLEGLWQLVDG